MTATLHALELTPSSSGIVEWGDGPAVVIAGAGTGKTRVIVERVRHLLETREDLQPENLLVLTYNVKAAAELRERIEAAVGIANAARMTISNFHSFCQGILTDNAGDAGLPARPDVLDGVGQVLLLRDLVPGLRLVYHGANDYTYANIVNFISRCKDELVRPFDFEAFAVSERRAFEERFGDAEVAVQRLETHGNLAPLRSVRIHVRQGAGQRARRGWVPGRGAPEGRRPRGATHDRRRWPGSYPQLVPAR